MAHPSSALTSPGAQPRRVSRARRLVFLVLALLLALFLPPLITLKSYSARIASSMQQALGRRVTVGAVSLRLLPRPGFDLKNLVIYDDPAFGAEPMLRADRVTADLRLTSLWRGRLEIARLSLQTGSDINGPSLNLVRAPNRRWNIEELLQRASQTPSAPTTQTHAEARPRFPYIEATGGRINLKIGNEKKVYALTNADFAFWLASENEWAFRLAAQPMRTDFNLSDTGTVTVTGRFRRAPTLRDTPLAVNITWQGAQLGQLTKLIYGHDRGWRGAVELNANLTGTPAALKIRAQAAVREFRRYDIDIPESLQLNARCTGMYSTATAQLSNLDCRLPLGSGDLLARGTVTGLVQPHAYDLKFSAEAVQLPEVLALARRAKRDIPPDLTGTGQLDGSFQVKKDGPDRRPHWLGDAQTTKAVLRSSVLAPQLSLPPMVFRLVSVPGHNGRVPQLHGTQYSREAEAGNLSPAPQPRLVMNPAEISLGGQDPATFRAWFNGKQYAIHARGEAQITRLLQAGHALGLPVPDYRDEGTARLDLQIAGNWSGFSVPQITGRAALRNVTLPLHGLNSPLQIASADLVLTPQTSILRQLELRFAGSPLEFAGSVQLPCHCVALERCPITFDLSSHEISLDALNHLLNPSFAQRPWYDVFAGGGSASALKRLQASGRIRAGRLAIRSLDATHVTANVRLASGVLSVTGLQAKVLGGRQEGDWRADFTAAQPTYTGTGSFSGIAMKQVAALMHDNWADGSASATYKLTVSGRSAGELINSAQGVANFVWQHGSLRHVTLGIAPLRFNSFVGQMAMRQGALNLTASKMATPAGIYEVSGTASLARQLGLKLRNGSHIYAVSGPLDHPKATLLTAQQAALKP